jgi:iron uptake system component EfeO
MPSLRFSCAVVACALCLVTAPACGPSDAHFEQSVASDMHDALRVDLQQFAQATQDLADAAPLPVGRGWDAQLDADALTRMRAAWVRARDLYEHVEGAIEPQFGGLDRSIDRRYEDELAQLGPGGDPYAFDGDGVVGLDAVERILWADTTPAAVVAWEATLPHASPAAFPATEQEAADFKAKLCGRLAADAADLSAQWSSTPLDVAGAYASLVSLVVEQRGEMDRATTNAVESRYSQRTLADFRANLEGIEAVYGLFRAWITAKGGAAVEAAFARLDDLFARFPGDALPPPPATWNAQSPSTNDLQSAYGQLYAGIADATDAARPGTVVSSMNAAAALLFP